MTTKSPPPAKSTLRAKPHPGAIHVIAEPSNGTRYELVIVPDPNGGHLIVWPAGPWCGRLVAPRYFKTLCGKLGLVDLNAIETITLQALKP